MPRQILPHILTVGMLQHSSLLSSDRNESLYFLFLEKKDYALDFSLIFKNKRTSYARMPHM
jgi:hypothetical protein